jgi:hypothetical protein
VRLNKYPDVSKGRLFNLYQEAFDLAKDVARENGYALAVHGSETRDLDLIAVPWVDKCCSPFSLAVAIAEKLKWWLHNDVTEKPHNRIAYLIYTHDHAHIDLSVIKPQEKGDFRKHLDIFTCNNCSEKETCPFAWDHYNTNGDCLAEK